MTRKPPQIPCLTVHQPFAQCIVLGYKPVENRVQRPPRWLIGKVLMIHAGKRKPDDGVIAQCDLAILAQGGIRLDADAFAFGAVVGCARVTGIVTLEGAAVPEMEHPDPGGRLRESMWSTGPFCWALEEPVAFANPIEVRGQQGIWYLPVELRPRVVDEWKVAVGKSY